MTNDIYMPILIQILTALAPVIITTSFTWLAVKASAYISHSTHKDYFLMLVRAAQQAIPDDSGDHSASNAARYNYVAGLAAKKFPGLDPAVVNSLIESSVHLVKTVDLATPAPAISTTNTVVNNSSGASDAPASDQIPASPAGATTIVSVNPPDVKA